MDASTGNMSECLRKARILAKMGSALLQMSQMSMASVELLEESLGKVENCALELDRSLATFSDEAKGREAHHSMVELVAEIQKTIAEIRQSKGLQREGHHLM
jgi:hypothetical protein